MRVLVLGDDVPLETPHRSKSLRPIVALLLVCLFCCHQEITRDSVIGTFSLVGPDNDVIFVESDGSYSHEFMTGSRKMKESGTWELDGLDALDGSRRLTFYDFTTSGTASGKRGIWAARIDQFFGRIRLLVDDDLKLYYEKK